MFTRTAKAECLAEFFFPQVSNTDLEDIGHTAYPDPVAFSTIDIKEIQKAILKFPSQSAPGTDQYPKQNSENWTPTNYTMSPLAIQQ